MQGSLVVSTDNGANWARTNLPEEIFYSLAVYHDSIYAGCSPKDTGSGGVYLSVDEGVNCKKLDNGLSSIAVRGILVVPELNNNGSQVFVVTHLKGIYRSSNGGKSWVPSGDWSRNPVVWTLAATYDSKNSLINLYAAIKDSFFISTDLGRNWMPIKASVKYKSSLSLFSYPLVSGLDSVLLAIADGKIFMVSNNGKKWTTIDEGMKNVSVYSISVNSNFIYAGTSSGIWKRPLSEIISISNPNTSMPKNCILEQNFPNPFNPFTNIRYKINSRQFITLKVYDLLRREVVTLVGEEKPAGNYEVIWNAADLSSGVYFYQIKAGNFTATKKLLLLK